MKYKLTNTKTKEETLCDKVTIDGFDYYVSDEIIKDVRPYYGKWQVEEGTILNKFPTYLTDLSSCRLVIATNNPNIDIPKVVDEVEILAYEHDVETFLSSDFDYDSFKAGYNKSQETHPNSDEDMIEFERFCNRHDYENGFGRVDRKELLQLWKEQQPKTLYYVST
jgi:hypothetical protein